MRTRVKAALSAGIKHLILSALVASLAAAVVFGLWYPGAYSALAGGRSLFLLLIAVDVVCGPLLTTIVYSPAKPRSELIRDIGIIVGLQFAALVYGLYSVAQARPVYLGYESGRFRVVSAADIDPSSLSKAPEALRQLSWTGPRSLGVRLLGPEDPGYADSIVSALAGLPPAFRPERWLPYDQVTKRLQADLNPMSMLKTKHPDAVAQIDALMSSTGLAENQVGYLPVEAEKAEPSDWVAVVQRDNGKPVGFLPITGW